MLPFAVNPVLKTLPTYQPGRPIDEVARELGLPSEQIIKLASNENPLGPSRLAMAAVRKAIPQTHLYPDGNAFYLKQKLASKLELSPAHLILGNGSNEIIEFLGHALLPRRAQATPEPITDFAHAATPGPIHEERAVTATAISSDAEVVVSQYCFAVYPIVTALFGAKLVTVPAKNYGHDLEAMLAAITPKTRLVFVANPNNPTGTVVSPEVLRRFIDAVPSHVVLALDEAYIEFLDAPLDMVPDIRAGSRPNLLLMRTFSKIYGLAGYRIGYGIGHPEFIAELEKIRQPFNINSLAQTAALAALDDSAHVNRTRRVITRGVKFFKRAFRKLGLEFVPSAANFILVRVGDGERVFKAMQQQGVIVRPLGGYQLPGFVRITIGTSAENQRCLEALQAALGQTPAEPAKSAEPNTELK